MAHFVRTPKGYRNETHDEVSAWPASQAEKGRKRAAGAPRSGGRFTSPPPAGSPAGSPAGIQPTSPAHHQPPSPSPSPYSVQRTTSTDLAADAAVAVSSKPEVGIPERFVQVFNAAFERRVGLTPEITKRVGARLKAGYKPWQIVALPILVRSRPMDADLEKRLRPEILLRDGRHPRTTRDGYTAGATDWLEREMGLLDQVVLSESLMSLATDAGVWIHLTACGVSVRKESGL